MAYTDRADLNYLGQLYLIGAYQTPFLNMIGGLSRGAKTTNSFNFPVAQPYSLRAADQSTAVKSEATSISDVTPITTTRGQDYNTCQIMKYPYGVSYAKESTFGEISGLAIAGQQQPVQSEFSFQRMAQFRQMALDIEYSCLRGSYVAQSTPSTVAKTRGILEAISTSTQDASAAALSKSLINTVLRAMAAGGAQFVNMVMFMGMFQKQAISNLYGYAPESRNVGGVNINQIETDAGPIGIVYDPFMPADDILFAEMSVISPMFCPHKGNIIEDKRVAETTAEEGGFWYTQFGLDYGPEEYHGSLTNLATS